MRDGARFPRGLAFFFFFAAGFRVRFGRSNSEGWIGRPLARFRAPFVPVRNNGGGGGGGSCSARSSAVARLPSLGRPHKSHQRGSRSYTPHSSQRVYTLYVFNGIGWYSLTAWTLM